MLHYESWMAKIYIQQPCLLCKICLSVCLSVCLSLSLSLSARCIKLIYTLYTKYNAYTCKLSSNKVSELERIERT